MPMWQVILSVFVALLTLAIPAFFIIRAVVKSRQNKEVEPLPDYMVIPPLDQGFYIMACEGVPIWVSPSKQLTEDKLNNLPEWIEEFIQKWMFTSEVIYPREKVEAALSDLKIIFIDEPYLDLGRYGLVNGCLYPDIKTVFIATLNKELLPKLQETIKNLIWHESAHMVLFYCAPELDSEVIQETHHKVIAAVLGC